MRVIYIITGLSTGGAEMMLLKLLERLNRQRFDPHVISLTTRGELGARIEELGISVEALGLKPGLPSPIVFFRLVQMLRRLKPDVVHTWMYHADLIGGLAARLAGVSAIGWCIRNSDLEKRRTRASTRAVARLCAALSNWLPTGILSCSETARQIHVAYGYAAGKMQVVPNGFDLTRFRPNADAREMVRSELGLDADALLVGLIGRFDPQKNHMGFIRAAGLLHRRMSQVHFVLAGRAVGKNNSMLMDAIAQEGMQDNVHLLGLRDDMPRLMAALDVLASSSLGEAFPNVLGEAMASGVPCVATDVGDSAWIVGDTGCIVSPGDSSGLAEGLRKVLELPAEDRRALGLRARARVVGNFDIDHVTRQYEAFYDGLVGRNGRAAAQ